MWMAFIKNAIEVEKFKMFRFLWYLLSVRTADGRALVLPKAQK